jgi:hypothetical protein
MNANHDYLREMAALIRSFGLQVRNVDELRAVLKELQSILPPESARRRAAMIATVVVGCLAIGMAGLVSCFILTGNWMAPAGREAPGYCLGGLGIVWGIAGVMVLGTVAACFGGPSPPPQLPPLPTESYPLAENSTSVGPISTKYTLP